MLISRCAWHRRYHGYTKVLGISSWRGLHVSFTDGICQKCAARVRADHLRARFDRGASADRRETPWLPGLAALTLSLVVALVLVARPTQELPPPVVAMLPPAPVVAAPPAARATSPARVTSPRPATRVTQQRSVVPAPRARSLVVTQLTVTRASAQRGMVVPIAPASRIASRDSTQSP